MCPTILLVQEPDGSVHHCVCVCVCVCVRARARARARERERERESVVRREIQGVRTRARACEWYARDAKESVRIEIKGLGSWGLGGLGFKDSGFRV